MNTGVAPHPVVGVLGGMGPDATVDFMRRVLEATPARDDADHIHMIVDCNPKIPSRIAALIDGTGISPIPELCRMAQSLQAQGATVLVMPCNTAHHYAGEIEKAVDIPLLHMPILTARHLAGLSLPNRRVGLLASTAVLKLEMYDDLLGEKGIDCMKPTEQDALMAVIRGVKAGDRGPASRQIVARIAGQLVDAGCDALLVACTELSLFAGELGGAVPVIDTLDVLVAETAAFVRAWTRDKPTLSAVGRQ